jgi:hypothetical protein
VRTLAAIAGAALLAVVLADGFNTIVLARRVQSVLRITRGFYRATWTAWTAAARRIHDGRRRENFLSIFGPLSLLTLMSLWAVGLVAAFGLLQWAAGLTIEGQPAGVAHAMYFSGTALFTILTREADRPVCRLMTTLEAGLGLSFLGLVVGYLPVLYQSYSTRELRIALMDARAGSPPSAAVMLRRVGATPARLEQQLEAWESWAAELLQHQLSYPMLGYFRSQHMNQSWVASLVAILDASALASLGASGDLQKQARATFAMSRHAMVDMARVFGSRPAHTGPDRLPPDEFARLRRALEGGETALDVSRVRAEELQQARGLYEPYAAVLSRHLLAALPAWVAEDSAENWRRADWERPVSQFAISDPFQESG